ncbi:MAG: Hpt domain-containing protein [Saprospiraceae bacterium]|nr:Hpt domain-containing protein [Saprospiraceae bacterium]
MELHSDKLMELLGSEEAAQRVINMFKQHWPAQLAELENALASEDWETAENSAHAMKSQCRYLGLTDVADLLQSIENQPKNKHDLSLLHHLLT